MKPEKLTPEEQRSRFERRGIYFPTRDHERDANKIQEIGYYKLKEFAYPFSTTDTSGEISYHGLKFNRLLVRYYQDKNFRIFMLHGIEDIEVRLNSVVAYRLGYKYGGFGYLDFKNWVDRNRPRFEIEKEQFYFKKGLLSKVKRSSLPDIKKPSNINSDGFPTVWTMVDALTFGDTLHLIDLMSPGNLRAISAKFGCTSTEFVSWMGCMNFIRNACVHNSDLIDIKLKTKPTPPDVYKDSIQTAPGGYSNGIAIAVYILKYLMHFVNPNYNFHNIKETLGNIIGGDDSVANALGFASHESTALLREPLLDD